MKTHRTRCAPRALLLPAALLLSGPTALAGGPVCLPQILGSGPATQTARDIDVQGTTVYCATDDAVDLFDVSSPTNPVRVGSWSGSKGLRQIAVDGGLALVAGGGLGTYVLDVSDPTQPTAVASLPAPDGVWAQGVEIEGTVGYVGLLAPIGGAPLSPGEEGGTAPFGELRSYDLTDPANPVLLQTLAAQAPTRLFLDGTRLFVAGGDGFGLLDVSDPTLMQFIGAYAGQPFLFDLTDVCASGDLAFVTNLDDPAVVIDLSDPASPFPTLQFGGGGRGLFAVGSKVYVAGAVGLRLFDVPNASSAQEIGAASGFGFPQCVTSDGELLYVGEFDAELTVFDPAPCEGSPFPSFCDGTDGALAGCPCANAGNPAAGCDVPQGTGGVRLAVLAQETGVQNRATLEGTGFPAAVTPTSIAIRGDALEATPVLFGDGLRCVGTPLVRLSGTFASGGAAIHTFGHGAMAGRGSFYYQLWFRSTPATYCTPDAFNLSNGRVIFW